MWKNGKIQSDIENEMKGNSMKPNLKAEKPNAYKTLGRILGSSKSWRWGVIDAEKALTQIEEELNDFESKNKAYLKEKYNV